MYAVVHIELLDANRYEQCIILYAMHKSLAKPAFFANGLHKPLTRELITDSLPSAVYYLSTGQRYCLQGFCVVKMSYMQHRTKRGATDHDV